MKKNKVIFYVFAVTSSICIMCIVAVIAINSNDPQNRASKYAEKYNGSEDAYLEIFSSTDCKFLQDKFDIAYENNQAAEAGTIYSIRATGFMTAIDERMREIGCYK